MIRRATAFWMMLAITAGIGLFLLKYEVKAMEEELAAIQRDTLENLEAIHMLKAEWSYLNRPVRLEKLGRLLLDLAPPGPDQTASITDIPLRPAISPTQDGDLPPTAQNEPPAADQPPSVLATFRHTP
jgi:hypothetical protein